MYARAKILAQNGTFWCYASLKGQKWAKIAAKLKKWQFSSTFELRNANL